METLDDTEGSETVYQYAGVGQIISAEYAEPEQEYRIPGGSSGGYTGLDRFGRLIEMEWDNGTANVVSFEYGYDRRGNRLFEKRVTPVLEPLYTPQISIWSELLVSSS